MEQKLKLIVKNLPSEDKQAELINEIKEWIQINYYS